MKESGADNLRRDDGRGKRIALLVSRFNHDVTSGLLQGALELLREKGVEESDLQVIEVPGAFELPQMARQVVDEGGIDGVICLGALIRGETAHFDVLAHAVTQSALQVGVETGIPVAFGVLTTDSFEQARARAATGPDNKGREAARAVLEMTQLFREHRRRGL